MKPIIIGTLQSLLIITIATVGYRTLKRSFNLLKSLSAKNVKLTEKKSNKQLIDKCPDLSSPYWTKIGEIDMLRIYPLKTNKTVMLDSCCSFNFKDYGMLPATKSEQQPYWDGMFLLYNKTKNKFENSQLYKDIYEMIVEPTNYNTVTLKGKGMPNLEININGEPNPSDVFEQQIWDGTFKVFYNYGQEVTDWLKRLSDSKDDLTLAQMLLHKQIWVLHPTLQNNWQHYVKAYKHMEEDTTGKYITLPQFKLITTSTYDITLDKSTANIIVNVDNPKYPAFKEIDWDWIRIGKKVILRQIKPIPSIPHDDKMPHLGIYCGLWASGEAEFGDEVLVHFSNTISL